MGTKSLRGHIASIADQVYNGHGLTDYVVGTVTSTEPLEVTLVNTMIPLPQEVLVLTANVIEKKVRVHGHIHQIVSLPHTHGYFDSDTGQGASGSRDRITESALNGSYPTVIQIENLEFIEHGEHLAIEEDGALVTVNRALRVGDEVVMLRVLDGQKFIILSRVFLPLD